MFLSQRGKISEQLTDLANLPYYFPFHGVKSSSDNFSRFWDHNITAMNSIKKLLSVTTFLVFCIFFYSWASADARTSVHNFRDLPLDLAITWTIGSARSELAYFADPNCRYCKKLENQVLKLDNVKIHLFIYPILGDESSKAAAQIFCAYDPFNAWHQYQDTRRLPKRLKSSCISPTLKLKKLGENYKVNGTPTIILEDNSMFLGSVKLEDLSSAIKNAERQAREEKTGFLYDMPGYCGGDNMINH